MEPSLSPILITLGLIFTIFAIVVQSDAQREIRSTPRPPASPLPSPPASHPPPNKNMRPPPRLPPPPNRSNDKSAVNASRHRRPPPQPSPSPNRSNNKSADNASHQMRPPPPKKHESINTGKKIGLLFAGIAAILQIGVVGFLVFKRRQLLKINDRCETNSS